MVLLDQMAYELKRHSPTCSDNRHRATALETHVHRGRKYEAYKRHCSIAILNSDWAHVTTPSALGVTDVY